jgi:SAM-dependent methyltransferase
VNQVAAENAEALEAWNGVLFDRFLKYRDVVIPSLSEHGRIAIELCPPKQGDRVLDVGCGFGDSAQLLGETVGPLGSVLGVDVAPRFIEIARSESSADNVRFEVCDVEVATFDEAFDYAFSRFGTMFFANPVAALRNVRRALVPDGRLVSVVWRQKLDNPWLYRAELAVKPLVEIPEETDEPRCGPGPFSMADADTVTAQLLAAGFVDVALRRLDLPLRLGRSLDEAVEISLALGPAAEAVRLAGTEGDALRPQLAELLHAILAEFETPDGIVAGSSTWVITASASPS